MPTRTIDSYQDCVDFITGCLFMATGGGGDPEGGLQALTKALEDGFGIGWVDAEDIDDDALTVTTYSAGSIAPRDKTTDQLIESLHLKVPNSEDSAMEQAIETLGEHLGTSVGCLVPVELGAGNSPGPLVAGARLGIPVVDGDYSGRAVPDEMQGTPFIAGKPGHPFVSVDTWGNTAVVTHTANPYMLERVVKMLSIAGVTGTTVASTPLRGSDMKQIVVAGTLTKCLAIGRACRDAVEAGDDPVEACLDVADGWRLFDGTVTNKDWEDRDGYMFGSVEVEGSGRWSGHTLKVWFKNENHVSWLDGQPWICSPDLVTLVASKTGVGYTSTQIGVGDQITAVGMRGLDVFRTPDALDNASGPRYFGFDIEYRPIETLLPPHNEHRSTRSND